MKIFIAMSGGVDSSVAAALLKEQGFHVEGMTMRFVYEHPHAKEKISCGDEAVVRAQNIAKILNIPHHVIDLSKQMNQRVVQYFASEYLKGRTPNPCVMCNRHVKFGALWDAARARGAENLATGHYVRVGDLGGDWVIKKAEDLKKDQSYFLWSIDKSILPRARFPLGDLKKDRVKKISEKLDLPAHKHKESQDICFIPEGYKDFLRKQFGPDVFVPGDFVNEKGRVVGQHQGILNYTIGQREKLGIALGFRAHVLKIDKERNQVHVGPKEYARSQGLLANQLNFFVSDISRYCSGLKVRIRYNAPEVFARVEFLENKTAKVIFDDPQYFVTPGQSVVFYKNDCVIGGGIIDFVL